MLRTLSPSATAEEALSLSLSLSLCVCMLRTDGARATAQFGYTHTRACARAQQESSATFAGMAMVVEAFETAGCKVVLDKRLPPLEQALLGGGGGDILLYRIQLQ